MKTSSMVEFAVAAVICVTAYKVFKPRVGTMRLDVKYLPEDKWISKMEYKRYPAAGSILDALIFRPINMLTGIPRVDHWYVSMKLGDPNTTHPWLCLQKDWSGNIHLTAHRTEMEVDRKSVTYESTWGRHCIRHKESMGCWHLGPNELTLKSLVEWVGKKSTRYNIFNKSCQTLISEFSRWTGKPIKK